MTYIIILYNVIPGVRDHAWVSSTSIAGDIYRITIDVSAVDLRKVWFADINKVGSQPSDYDLCRVGDDQRDE